MPKNIIICSDGTGNSDIKGRGTNVFKLFESIDLNGHRINSDLPVQLALYDDGVGTERIKWLAAITGALGWGLGENVRQLYKELARIYDPGDRIFLFGFSRGAFTVRTLVGMIAKSGILKTADLPTKDALNDKVEALYKCYRLLSPIWYKKMFCDHPNPSRLADRHYLKDEEIPFMGIWDTVDAVGLPFSWSNNINDYIYRFKFKGRTLSDLVKRACHALSIDDQRKSFHPLLWKEKEGGDYPRIKQVWFSGMHSNVGGGYPKQGMSLVPLAWIMSEAKVAGLRIIESDDVYYREHANVDDTLYDSRSGFGNLYRWLPRNIEKICKDNNVKPRIHLSVLERITHGTGDYAPGNLPPDAEVVITGDDAVAQRRAKNVEKVFCDRAGGKSLLSEVDCDVQTGIWACRWYLAFLLALVVLIIKVFGFSFITNLLTGQLGEVWMSIIKVWEMSPWSLVSLVLCGVGFLVSFYIAQQAKNRMGKVFSGFWHNTQQALRTALKKAQKTDESAR